MRMLDASEKLRTGAKQTSVFELILLTGLSGENTTELFLAGLPLLFVPLIGKHRVIIEIQAINKQHKIGVLAHTQ